MNQLSRIQNLPWKEITAVSKSLGMDQAVMAAICLGESAGDQYAQRFEPGWKFAIDTAAWAKKVGVSEATERNAQMCSWGLMQIMGTVARERGCDFDLPRLVDVVMGLTYGGKQFMALMFRYHNDLDSAVSAYNAGSATKDSNGHFTNQSYVDTFHINYADVRAYLHT